MSDPAIEVAEDFLNYRGVFRIGGVLDVGTHCSLVRLKQGGFVFLDAYTLSGDALEQARAITNQGRDVAGILNLHPFHTVHVRRMHEQFPHARLYGTARHHRKAPDLPWEAEKTEEEALHERFSADLEFSVPEGVDFISANENVHFSSVLAYHRASRTMHVDDTLFYVKLPRVVGMMGWKDSLRFHPTLPQALERRPGAGAAFRAWAVALAGRWGETENLCTAHVGNLLASTNDGPSIRERVLQALEKVDGTLTAHDRKQVA